MKGPVRGICRLVLIGVVSIIYGAFAAMAQTDFKRLVAYSSVSHMGYVILGIAVWKITDDGVTVGKDYWSMGMNGAMFQMIGHGVSSAGMFFMVGVIYDRVHHRDLNQFGGLFGKMPVYGGLGDRNLFRRFGAARTVRFLGRSLYGPECLELQPVAGHHCRFGGDPDGRLYPVGHATGLSGPGIQGSAPEDITPMHWRESLWQPRCWPLRFCSESSPNWCSA